MDDRPFWQHKSLRDMTPTEWESLCDRCARCCLVKLEDEETGDVDYTNIACRLLDHGKCVCKRYDQRKALVPDCVALTPDMVEDVSWLPSTCAYRLIAEDQDLYWWHPLVSGSPETVHQAGISVRGRIVAEDRAGDPEDHIVTWPT